MYVFIAVKCSSCCYPLLSGSFQTLMCGKPYANLSPLMRRNIYITEHMYTIHHIVEAKNFSASSHIENSAVYVTCIQFN